MVAPASLPPPSRSGRSVRLLVGLLAWPDPQGGGNVHARPRGPKFLSATGTYRLAAAAAPGRPGAAVIADAAGDRWTVPVGFLDAVTPTEAAT